MPPVLTRLKAISEHICSPRTVERLVDPVLNDTEVEYRYALEHHGVWRARWVLSVGVVALVKTLTLHESSVLLRTLFDRSVTDQDGLRVAFWSSSIAILTLTCLLTAVPLQHWASKDVATSALLFLIPQALSLAVPMGVTFGLFYGLRRGAPSPRTYTTTLTGAIICSIGMLLMLDRVLPAANQAFRVSTSRTAHAMSAPPKKALPEMTLRELREALDAAPPVTRWETSSQALVYHMRPALAAATISLSVLALAICRWRRFNRAGAVTAAISICFVYYWLLFLSRAAYWRRWELDLPVPPYAAAWFANIVCFALALAYLRAHHEQSEDFPKPRA